MYLVGKTLEDARQHFLDHHGDFYKFASSGDRTHLQSWLDTSPINLIEASVKYAMFQNRLEDSHLKNELESSLRFRVLAGILNRPIEYDTEDILEGGLCGCQEWDAESGGWPCKVPGNQSQADAWHEKFGNGPACPFYKNPNKQDPLQKSETEIEKMLYDEDKNIDEALSQLGLRHRK